MTCVGVVALSVNTTVKDCMVTSFESTKMFSSRWKIRVGFADAVHEHGGYVVSWVL
jgi:hypothetical protein